MIYKEFHKIIVENERPVILVEGTRKVPEEDIAKLSAFAQWLAKKYPHARFRTGNADGSDTAFARGIAAVDASRLEYVLPYTGHRKKTLAADARHTALTELSKETEDLAVHHTSHASPEYDTMMGSRYVPRLKAKTRYILRDTIKVIGAEEAALAPATIGLFYVNLDDPMKGGTGHTIRVCHKQGIKAIFQDEWLQWSMN